MADNKELKARIVAALAQVKRKGMADLRRFLETSDFFTAPASTRFHSAYPGGLAEHSWHVYEIFKEKVARYGIELPEESIILCGLLHDVCKIGLYRAGKRNVKLDGKWVEVDTWECDDEFPFGHGEKSVHLIQRYVVLTDEEALAIRWHMGFSEPRESWRSLHDAADMYPSVMALHAADLEASHLVEPREGTPRR